MRLRVQGKTPLRGNYRVSGNTNEAVALIAASLLHEEETILKNVPDTAAVRQMLEIASDMGTAVRREGDTLHLYTPRLASRQIHPRFATYSVAAIFFLAPMLARRDYAVIQWTESFERINTHLTALRDLGLRIEIQGQLLTLTSQKWEKQHIVLTETSVTATALVCMLAAVMGQETVIYNAASEPHLRSLQELLVKMGAKIQGTGSNLLYVYGGELHGATHTVQSDHVEAASIAAISAFTPGFVTIESVNANDLRIINRVYQRLGAQIMQDADKLHIAEQSMTVIPSTQSDVDVTVSTAPWPGFPSDLVAIATVLATQTNGTTLIHEKMFNNRLLFVDKLKSMGAQIILCDPHRAVVVGATPLRAEYIDSPDVRIGLGLLGAALCAEGESVIDRAELLGRNFDNVIQKLIGLGAGIEVIH